MRDSSDFNDQILCMFSFILKSVYFFLSYFYSLCLFIDVFHPCVVVSPVKIIPFVFVACFIFCMAVSHAVPVPAKVLSCFQVSCPCFSLVTCYDFLLYSPCLFSFLF